MSKSHKRNGSEKVVPYTEEERKQRNEAIMVEMRERDRQRDLREKYNFLGDPGPWDKREFTTQPLLTASPQKFAGLYWPAGWKSWLAVIAVLVFTLWKTSQLPSVHGLHFPDELIIPSLMMVPMFLFGITKSGIDRNFHVSVYPDGYAEYDRGLLVRALRWADIVTHGPDGNWDGQWDFFPIERRLGRGSERAFACETCVDGEARQFAILFSFAYNKSGFDLKNAQALRKCFFDSLLSAKPWLHIHPDVWTMLCLDPETRAYSPWRKQAMIMKMTTFAPIGGGALMGAIFLFIDHLDKHSGAIVDMFAGFPPWYLVAFAWYCFMLLIVTFEYV